ncbi:MAG TPA: hypothetical protein PKD35_11810 [Nitrosomonas sp.]|nr:hypothetical protein [Nitrosomonas sp.]
MKYYAIDAHQSNLRTINSICEVVDAVILLKGSIRKELSYALVSDLLLALNQANYTNKCLNQYLTPDKGLNTSQEAYTEQAISKALDHLRWTVKD